MQLDAIDDLDKELERVNADPMLKLIIERQKRRSEAWQAFVGYTRERPVQSDSVDDAERTAAELQTQIDSLRRHVP